MDTLLRVGLSNAAAATALALAATLVGRFCRRPALAHGLWLLVLLKLITPPLWNVSVAWPAAEEAAVVAAARSEEPADEVRADVEAADLDWLEALEATGLVPAEELAAVAYPELRPGPSPENVPARTAGLGEPPVSARSSNPGNTASLWSLVDWKEALLLLWVTGSLVWFCLAFFRIGRFLRLLRFAEAAPAWLQEETRILAGRMELSRVPGVWLVCGRLSPMLWAFGKPRLLVPAELLGQLSAEQRATLLAHELAHLVRGDHWVRLLQLLVTGLYWWHPAVWWARREMQEAEEQCCDAWVVWALPDSARTYATALMETVDFLSEARPVLPPVASGIGHVHDLRRRLTMIMRGTTPRALTWGGYLAVLAAGALLLPLVPSLADEPVRVQVRLVEDEKEKDKVQVRLVEDDKDKDKDKEKRRSASPEDQKRAQAEMERAEAEMKKAQAQMQEAMARMREAQRRMAEMKAQAGSAGGGSGKGGPPAKELPKEMKRMTIIIQDANGKEIKRVEVPSGEDLRPKIEAALQLIKPAEFHRDMILRFGEPEKRKGEGDKQGERRDEKRDVIIRQVGPGGGIGGGVGRPGAGGGGGAGPDRMADIEKRLESLMRELEALRREIRRGGAGEGPRGPGAGAGLPGAPGLRPGFGAPEPPRPPNPPSPPERPARPRGQGEGERGENPLGSTGVGVGKSGR